jgi:putative transposase
MQSVMVAFSHYFNRKYGSSGVVFRGKYQASPIDDEVYLAHITRYIHLNPRTYRTYYWSSLKEYLGERQTDWLKTRLVNEMKPAEYLRFLEDWQDYKKDQKRIRKSLII